MSRWIALKLALKQHYSAPPEASFRQFRAGLIYFAVGLGAVLMATSNMPSSATQELIVLGGLILGGIGFIIAMTAQMRSIISRFVRFFRK